MPYDEPMYQLAPIPLKWLNEPESYKQTQTILEYWDREGYRIVACVVFDSTILYTFRKGAES